MKLIEVKDKSAEKLFLQLPKKIYSNDKNWVQPLNKEIEKVFDPNQNLKFEKGEAIRWLLEAENKQIIGRVAAFIDYNTAYLENQATGAMGFFDCVNDEKAASNLLQVCQDWLTEKGMKAMDGPVNFGDRNNWWGLLIDGFKPPSYGAAYNPPYYRKFFEDFGFQNYFEQYTYMIDVRTAELGERFKARAERLKKNNSYSIRHIELKKMKKYTDDFREIYNQGWKTHENFVEMTEGRADQFMKELKPIIDERLIWYTYYQEKPVAFMVMIPEMNQLFYNINGKLDWIGKLKFAWNKWTGKCDTALGIAIGVIPRFQGRGIESAMIEAFSHYVFRKDFPYYILEFNWVGDFHPNMMKVYDSLGASISKKHITYRKLFDEKQTFERHPIVK